jgi:hypothetical protein
MVELELIAAGCCTILFRQKFIYYEISLDV